MKRYKLIKTYPDSPELGTIITKSCDYEYYNFDGGDFTTLITGFL